jgi:hypothetical protein
MRDLESEILAELKAVAKNNKLRIKDMLEWTTGEIKPHEGEVVYNLPKLGINVAIKAELSKSEKKEVD